jgi:penicillin-binding protein 1A
MARGYAVLANGGYLVEPYFIHRVEQDGQVVYESTPATVCEACEQTGKAPEPDSLDAIPVAGEDAGLPPAPRVLPADNRFIMYSMMQDVITRGTARRARVLGRSDLAGKTGTTNDQRDAWFNGYNQSLVAISWMGFDSNKKLGRGEVGGRAALPAWIDYMKVALNGIPDDPPQMPDNMVTVRIDPETGLRAPAGMPDSIFEVFRSDEVPELAAPTVSRNGVVPDTGNGGGGAVVEQLF